MKTTIIAVITLVLAVAAYWFAAAPESASHPVDLEQANHSSSTQESAPAVPPVADWTSELVNEFQIQAMAAVTNTLGQPEFTDRIEKRPDFVSPAEWLILSSIAQQHDNPDAELTRMINFLRFSKLMEIWESGDDMGTLQRSALAEQLLLNIPNRVENGDLGLSQAQQLQATLINDLTTDSDLRRQRLSEENARIGVTFEIN